VKYISIKPLLVLGIALAAIIVLIARAQFHGTGTPILVWGLPAFLVCAILALWSLVVLAKKQVRAGVTILAAALIIFSAVFATASAIALAERLRLEKYRAEYMTQISKLPVVDGQRVQAFPWSDERNFGPAYLLYDEADALYRATKQLPAAWTLQAQKTSLAQQCLVNKLDVLDVRHISGHFYVVGCEAQWY
jgi:hypothetical protein